MHLLLATLTLVPLDGTGILDWVDSKNTAVQTTLRGLAITLAIVFVVWQAVSSRGALARIAISALVAGLFVWIVFNVTALKSRVDNEVNGSSPSITTVYRPAPPASRS